MPGQVLVKFRKDVGAARRSAILAAAGVDQTLARLGPQGRRDVRLVRLEGGTSVPDAVATLRRSKDVLAAEPNYIRQATALPNDPFFANQWGLFNNGQLINGVTGVVNADIQAEVAWDSSERGASNPVTVAVIDSGIDGSHPDLQGHLWTNPGETAGDGLDNDGNGYVDDVSGYNMAGISQRYFNAIWTVGNADTDSRAQSITGTGRPLTRVGLFVGTVGTPTADIQVVVRDSLGGTDLAAGTIAAADVPAAGGVVNATLSPSPTLTAGTTYYLMFRVTAFNAANHYQVYGNANTQPSYRADPYRGGTQHWWSGTAWVANAANDWSFTTNANATPLDDNGHGTHVSGIVAAGIDNGVGIAGVSYGARIMAIKAGSSNGSFTSADIVEALNYAADNGAKIINMSFGGDTTSSFEQDAVLRAYRKGAALFAAAGNDGDNSHNFPASYSRVVSVAATTNRDTRASYSNYNASVDVSAPGDFIYSTMPTYPVALTSAGVAQDYAYLSGTSMASPMAAGLAALILSRNPEYTAEQVMSVIETKLRDDLGTPGYDQSFGFGRINGVLLANEVLVGNNRIDGNWYIAPSPFGETLDSAGDRQDVFSVSVAAGQRVKVGMTAAGAADFDLRLYPPGTTDAALASGAAGAVAASAGGTYPEAFTYLAPAGTGGTYYLQVGAKSGHGSYTIDYSVKDADDEIPGVPIPASPIAGGLQFFFDENDVYSVSLAAGEQLVASLTAETNRYEAFPLSLYPPGSTDFSSSPVATSAGGLSYPQAIKYVVPAGGGGTYYLRAAFPFGGLGGPYTLTYSVGPADLTPPVTALSLSPALPDGDNGWYRAAPTITLAANEAGVTHGQWDATGSGGWWTYSGPFAAPEGDHTLHYYSVDAEGNVETAQDRGVKTDLSAPTAPTLLTASGDSATAVTLSWAASTDPVGGSGRSGYRVYNADSGVLLGSPSDTPYQITGVTAGVQNRYYVTAVDTAGNESGHSDTAVIATLAAGSNVPISVGGVGLTFSSIGSGGGVTVTTSATPPASQTGFELNGVYYDISTTASYSGFITVTLPYDPATVADPQALRLYHYDATAGSWVDVTTGVDTVNHTISGKVTSFSWFAAGPPLQRFGGFERPLDDDHAAAVRLGQTVPVKFRLTDGGGRPVTEALARIFVAKMVNGVAVGEKPGTSTNPGSGNTFRYDREDHYYIFDLETKRLSPGIWRIRVLLDDGLSYVAMISLR